MKRLIPAFIASLILGAVSAFTAWSVWPLEKVER